MCEKGRWVCSGGGQAVINGGLMNEPQASAMTTQSDQPSFKDASEAFEQKVQGRLHAYVKEIHQGRPAVSCIWNETPTKTFKEIVYLGAEGFDALQAVQVLNKSMKASVQVVTMLIDLYNRQSKVPLGEGTEY